MAEASATGWQLSSLPFFAAPEKWSDRPVVFGSTPLARIYRALPLSYSLGVLMYWYGDKLKLYDPEFYWQALLLTHGAGSRVIPGRRPRLRVHYRQLQLEADRHRARPHAHLLDEHCAHHSLLAWAHVATADHRPRLDRWLCGRRRVKVRGRASLASEVDLDRDAHAVGQPVAQLARVGLSDRVASREPEPKLRSPLSARICWRGLLSSSGDAGVAGFGLGSTHNGY